MTFEMETNFFMVVRAQKEGKERLQAALLESDSFTKMNLIEKTSKWNSKKKIICARRKDEIY